MVSLKKLLASLLTGCLMLGAAACASNPAASTSAGSERTAARTAASAATEETSAGTQSEPAVTTGGSATVIDAAGLEVTVPEAIQRIVITCRGGTTNEVSIFGDPQMILGQPPQSAYAQLLRMYPYFETVTDPGSFEDTNIEEVLALEPDIVFAGVSSPKANEKLRESGLTVYTMQIGWATTETILDEFMNMGKILKNEAKAKQLVEYWQEKMALVNRLVSAVPESERKTVYYTSKTITDANTGDWGQSWIRAAGGKPVIEGKFNGDVSVEQVLEWDPDVILTHAGSGIDAVMNDERVQELKAIQQQAVYGAPTGAFWWDRPSPESPLSFLWLAKVLYPEYTGQIDLKAETAAFFKTFYEYDLTDEEYEAFFK